jgi:hypothetical protein
VSESSEESVWLTPIPAAPLDGSERFVGLDATVADFWRWAFSDLRDNTTRGILAEFLVGRAVGDERGLRIGWDNFDAQTPDGTTIEVKCSAFLQSWTQKRPSDLIFGRLSAREFDATRNEYSVEPRVRADVFVFAVQMQRDPASYDMLDLAHWEFWVVNAETVRGRAGKTVGVGWVREHSKGRCHTASWPTPSARPPRHDDRGRRVPGRDWRRRYPRWLGGHRVLSGPVSMEEGIHRS